MGADRRIAANGAVTNWARTDPQTALGVLDEIPPTVSHYDVYAALAKVRVKTDSEAALSGLSSNQRQRIEGLAEK